MWAYSGIYRLVLFSDVFFSFWPKYIKNKCKGMHSAAKSLKSVANGGRDSICAASSPRLLAPYLLLINATQLIVSFCTITATGHEACCLENQHSTFCARDLLVRQLLLGTIQLLTFLSYWRVTVTKFNYCKRSWSALRLVGLLWSWFNIFVLHWLFLRDATRSPGPQLFSGPFPQPNGHWHLPGPFQWENPQTQISYMKPCFLFLGK